jgi:hypothetical protein
MPQIRNYAPPYCQIVIRDPTAKVDVPEWEKGVPLVATDTCILCSSLPDMDGETEFVLGSNKEVHMEGPAAFEGMLKTPGHKIALRTVEGDVVLEMPTAGPETLVRIWINRSWSPDRVHVAIG